MVKIRLLAILFIATALCFTNLADVLAAPSIDDQLQAGQLSEAEEALADHLATVSEDDLARFQLGFVQLLQAIEQLAQDGARYGTLSRSMMLPFIRVGGFVADDQSVEPVEYEDIRQMIARFQKAVAHAEETLAPISSTDLYWPLDMNKVSLDLNGDGEHKVSERLENLFRIVAGRGAAANPGPIRVGLDSADVYWLRGYCHVLMALADMTLAYDHQRLFDLTAHVFFADPQTKFARQRDPDLLKSQRRQNNSWDDIYDLIAAIHLFDFKLHEPRRLADAHQHLLKMVELSRRNWELINEETDNRNELIPNANQKSIIPGLTVDAQRLEAWQQFLNEAEAILQGEKLLPFWRKGFDEGINLKRVFTDPRDFDLVLWVQGTAALPYLERGDQTAPETWREFQRIFRGNFVGFAMWVN